MPPLDTDAHDREDMRALVAGHEAALNQLMDRHAAAVQNFLNRWLQNPDEAADLAQETFVRVFLHAADYRSERRFSTWLYTIAANLARNQLRSRARHPTVSLDAPASGENTSLGETLPDNTRTGIEEVSARERGAAVRDAVADLPPDLREAVVLCELEDHPLAEAAKILGATVKAVESRLYRARKQLREALAGWL